MIMVTASDAAYSKRNFYEMTSPASVSDEHALDSKIGTVNDARDMDRLGKKQELRVTNMLRFTSLNLLLTLLHSETLNSFLY